MKLEQLIPIFDQVVTVQFHRDHEWVAVAHHSTFPNGAHQGTIASHEGQPIGAIDTVSPAVLHQLATQETSADGQSTTRQYPAIVITHPGPDGSTLQTLCDPESILYVTQVLAPPQASKIAADSGPRIVMP